MARIATTQLEMLALGTRVRVKVPRRPPLEIHRMVVPPIGGVRLGRTTIWSDDESTEFLFGTVKDFYSLSEVVGIPADAKIPGGELDPEPRYMVELDGGEDFVIVTPDMVRAPKAKRSRKTSQ